MNKYEKELYNNALNEMERLQKLYEDAKQMNGSCVYKIVELENEIKELKRELDKSIDEQNDLSHLCDRLQEDNEQLKKQVQYDSRYNDMQAEIDCGEKLLKQYKEYVQWILDQFDIDTKEAQDRALKLLTEVDNG